MAAMGYIGTGMSGHFSGSDGFVAPLVDWNPFRPGLLLNLSDMSRFLMLCLMFNAHLFNGNTSKIVKHKSVCSNLITIFYNILSLQ